MKFVMPRPKPTLEQTINRFWSKVNRLSENDCWEWLAGKLDFGYGQFWDNEAGRSVSSHTFAYKITKGDIPKDKVVRHSCDNPACCNPNHLLLGTPAENNHDMKVRGRAKPGLKDKPERSSKYEEHYLSKFTNEEVKQLREDIKSGKDTIKSVAQKFNVTYQCIWLIAKERNWKNYEISK